MKSEGEERHWGVGDGTLERGGGTVWGGESLWGRGRRDTGEEGHYGEGEVVINYELTRQWG